jgi:ribosomal protein S14
VWTSAPKASEFTHHQRRRITAGRPLAFGEQTQRSAIERHLSSPPSFNRSKRRSAECGDFKAIHLGPLHRLAFTVCRYCVRYEGAIRIKDRQQPVVLLQKVRLRNRQKRTSCSLINASDRQTTRTSTTAIERHFEPSGNAHCELVQTDCIG